jgi:hypothetical protein
VVAQLGDLLAQQPVALAQRRVLRRVPLVALAQRRVLCRAPLVAFDQRLGVRSPSSWQVSRSSAFWARNSASSTRSRTTSELACANVGRQGGKSRSTPSAGATEDHHCGDQPSRIKATRRQG